VDDDRSPALDARLAGELDGVRGAIEDLAVRLCLDPVVFERHGATLQQFDHLAQIVGEVATVLRREGPDGDALAAIRLTTMRDRLANYPA
jgi:hypothetical protein